MLDDVLGVPEKATEKCENQHACGGDSGGTTKDDERQDENTGTIPRGNGRQELLDDATQEEESDQADDVG